MNPFRRVTPDPEQHAIIAGLTAKFASLYADISACLPDSRYKTEALMQLEIAGMVTTKGITHGTKEVP